jgi:hypothetical protein
MRIDLDHRALAREVIHQGDPGWRPAAGSRYLRRPATVTQFLAQRSEHPIERVAGARAISRRV